MAVSRPPLAIAPGRPDVRYASGGFVEYDAAAHTYLLPAEHAAVTTRAAGPDNLAFFAQYVGLMRDIEPEIVPGLP